MYRPPVPSDHVYRPELLERLEKQTPRAMTLVSAPAGYGKTTLVSCWLERSACPSAFLALDEHDNDLRQFLSYFLGAVQTISPAIGLETPSILNAPDLPPVPVIGRSLANDLHRIEEQFILVLDDFHCIHDKSVHVLLREILRHPPRSMHLVMVTRKDPFLPISTLRALNRVTEVRTRDLRFTDPEVHVFLKSNLGDQIENATSKLVAEKTEGWVTGLRLAVLAMRGHDEVESELSELTGTTRYVMDYLISEVLANQSLAARHFLLRSSILDRFSSSLCDALRGPDDKRALTEMDGETFITGLLKDNAFLIALDRENHWFRYHHLFKDLLQRQMKGQFKAEEIAALHSRASEWFESRGYIEEAIDHALAAGDALAAAKVIEQSRHAALDTDQWHALQRWLNRIPPEIQQVRPILLLSKAWILLFSARMGAVLPIIERVESLLDKDPEEAALLSEINFFRGLVCYFKGDGESSVAFFTKATEQLPKGSFIALRSQAEYWLCVALHLNGRKKTAIRRLHQGIRSRDLTEGMLLSRMVFGLCFIHMLNGECLPAYQEGLRLRELGSTNRLVFAETWGMYVQGNASFQMFDLDAARRHFSRIVENRYIANPRAAVDAMAGLSMTRQFMGEPDEADETIRLAQEYAEWTKEPMHFDIVRSCRARIALLRGDLDSASRWLRSLSETSGNPIMLFFLENPAITECRVLIATGSDVGLKEAIERLDNLQQNSKAWQNTCQMMEIMILRAQACQRRGRLQEALKVLERAVAMAEPGGTIRPFRELGQPMANLLKKLAEKNVAVEFIEKLLAAFPPISSSSRLSRRLVTSKSSSPSSLTVEPLTNRELDVLELLAQRLRNKEIAEKLFISPETVRTHLQNIYQKIDVCNRSQAVASAVTLGILPAIENRPDFRPLSDPAG